MRIFFKKYWYIILILLIGIPAIVGIVIAYIPGNGSNDGWLGFWGSYLGTIPSGVIAYFVAKIQMDAEKDNYRKNHLEDLLLDDLRELYGYLINFKESVEDFCFNETVESEEAEKFIDMAQEKISLCDEMENIISRIPNYAKKGDIENLFQCFKNSLINVSDIKITSLKSYSDKNKLMKKQLGILAFNPWSENFSQGDLKKIQNEEVESYQKWEKESIKLKKKINVYVENYSVLEETIRSEIDRLSKI